VLFNKVCERFKNEGIKEDPNPLHFIRIGEEPVDGSDLFKEIQVRV